MNSHPQIQADGCCTNGVVDIERCFPLYSIFTSLESATAISVMVLLNCAFSVASSYLYDYAAPHCAAPVYSFWQVTQAPASCLLRRMPEGS